MTTTDASFGNTVSFISFNEKKSEFPFSYASQNTEYFSFSKN